MLAESAGIMKTILITGLAAALALAACNKDDSKPATSETKTTSAEMQNSEPKAADVNDQPAAPNPYVKTVAPKDPQQATTTDNAGAKVAPNATRDAGPNRDLTGGSFESSGGSSGLGTPAHQDVPGQKIWSTK
jgi:hypothetical protein